MNKTKQIIYNNHKQNNRKPNFHSGNLCTNKSEKIQNTKRKLNRTEKIILNVLLGGKGMGIFNQFIEGLHIFLLIVDVH